MALASSGSISIGGATSGRSINLEMKESATALKGLGDNDCRIVAGVSSGAISLSNFYGKDIKDVQFLTVGVSTGSYSGNYGYSNNWTYGGTMGSVTDNTLDAVNGAAIRALYHTGGMGGYLNFYVWGNHSNSGWTSINFPNAGYTKTYTRASASYGYSSYWGMTTWSWGTTPNPFSSSGTVLNIIWMQGFLDD